MEKFEDRCGFEIMCLDCKRVLKLNNYNNDVLKMKDITVTPVQDLAEIECECGNSVICYYG